MRKILVLPDADRPVVNAAYDSLYERHGALMARRPAPCGRISRCHPLIDAVHIAFSQHRPLTLSPDAIWLTIAQGFGHHVAANAETLRGRLVRHEGRETLTSRVESLEAADFKHAIADFSAQIRAATDPVLHETLVCDFSTTTPAIRTASEVALMDSFSSYFEYAMLCVCGIPKITVEGSLADWQRIRARVEVLETYGLEWWVSRLRLVLDEFVRTAAGHPSPEFWKAIYKPLPVYADEEATGWIADLFPYLGDGPSRVRSHIFQHERRDWMIPADKGVPLYRRRVRGVVPKSFPAGLSSVPVKLKFIHGRELDVVLLAGFFAVKQDPTDGALSPLIGWSATEPAPATPVIVV
jgi:hypothetical protein